MSTPFTEIYDRALIQFKDWKMDELFLSDEAAFYQYLEGYLVNAASSFTNCAKSLDYTLGATPIFDETLNNSEIKILSKLLVMEWLTQNINNISKFDLHLTDNDFKHFSEQQNLLGKLSLLTTWREVVDRDMNTYYRDNGIDWDEWRLGNYDPD